MLFRITDQPIAPDALHDLVLHPKDGAVVTFSGVVRGETDGRRTDHLVYEAYAPMAERAMALIGDELRRRWGVVDVGMLHRVGRLAVGEISVLIAVAMPHRADAFAACRYAIDRLKESAPIWKKEVGEDGETWVEGTRPAPMGP